MSEGKKPELQKLWQYRPQSRSTKSLVLSTLPTLSSIVTATFVHLTIFPSNAFQFIFRNSFQQQGAALHYRINVGQLLDEKLSGSRIGRAVPIPWPARSPNSVSIQFFLRENMNDNVCQTSWPSLTATKRRITPAIRSANADMLRNV